MGPVLKVKLIASLGPTSSDFDTIKSMALAGASGFRINFAHGDQALWKKLASLVREVEEQVGRPIALIGDLRGPSLRVGKISGTLTLRRGDKVKFVKKEETSASRKEIPVPIEGFHEAVEEGNIILMSDGKVKFRITEVKRNYVGAVALSDAKIESNKALSIKGKEPALPPLTDKDLNDIKFACKEDFDYISFSYVRTVEDIGILRRKLEEIGCNAKVIAKIETKSAVKNLDSIIMESDAVLIARGDLGMNLGLEEVPYIQKLIVDKSLTIGKPVIVATQLLESMIESPVPTRAEVVDVTVAVSEGVDALMLTGETAVGKYPVEAVKWLRKIAYTAESKITPRANREGGPLKRRFAKGVAELAEDLKAKLVIYSMRGTTARFVSSLRPTTEFFIAVPSPKVARQLNILWGVNAIIVTARDYDEGLSKTYEYLLSQELLKPGDLVVLTYGMRGEEQVIRVKRVVA